MRIYLIYIISSLLCFFIIMIYYGVSAGVANYIPIIALIGSVILFTIAAPIWIYKYKIGLIAGLIGIFLLLPYTILFLKGVLEDGVINWVIPFAFMPLALCVLGIVFSVRALLVSNESLYHLASLRGYIKFFLSAMPILFFIIYLIFYGKYWS